MAKNFNENLKELMRSKGLSARKLAEELKLSQRTLSDWLKNEDRIPRSAKTLREIAKYFGVTESYLLYGEDPFTPVLEAMMQKTKIFTGTFEITVQKIDIKGMK